MAENTEAKTNFPHSLSPAQIAVLKKLADAILSTNSVISAEIAAPPAAANWCSMTEAARILGLSKSTIYRRCNPTHPDAFPFKCRKSGRSYRFFVPDLEAYLAGMK